MTEREKNYTIESLEQSLNIIINYFKRIYKKQDNPKVILLGGQPGAGKSNLENMLNIHDEFIFINGDDYRKYHPKFDELNKIYEKEASKHTQKWFGEITENLIKEFRNEKYNLIIEGTLRTYELPLNEAKRFKENNYSQINLYIIAVKPKKSYLSTLLRYEKMIEHGQNPRITPKEHHDLVVSNICNNLSKLYEEKIFNNIQLYDRENNLLYDMKKTPNINPKEILENEFKRPWLKEEFFAVIRFLRKVTDTLANEN